MSVAGNLRRETASNHVPHLGTVNETSESLEPPSDLDRSKGYKVGFRLFDAGEIYEGWHPRLSAPFVMKLFWRAVGEDSLELKAFSTEAGRISVVRHPHIAQVLDSGVLPDRTPFLARERLYGETLEERLSRRTPWFTDDVLSVVRGTAAALSDAHAVGVVHREIRPDNVFLVDRADGEPEFVKLLDFGVSRLTWAKRTAGRSISLSAARYLAPEQARGDLSEMDARTDQYALAVLTYRMLSGGHPFPGDRASDITRSGSPGFADRTARSLEPPRLGVSAVDEVLRKALSRRPEDRFLSVNQFAQALEDALSGSDRISFQADRPWYSGAVTATPARPDPEPRVGQARDAAAAESPDVSAPVPLQVDAESVEESTLQTAAPDMDRDDFDFEPLKGIPRRRTPLVALFVIAAVLAAGLVDRKLDWRFPRVWRGSAIPLSLFLLGSGAREPERSPFQIPAAVRTAPAKKLGGSHDAPRTVAP